MIALNYNILQDYSAITMTNENANYPITNIFSTMLTLISKTTAQASLVTITFAADQSADMFAMAFSNLTVASTVVCVYKNAGGAVLFTDNLVKDPWYTVKSYFAKLTTIRSIEITITNAVAVAFYFGTIWIGEKIVLPDIAAYHKKDYGDMAPVSEGWSGQVAGQIKGLLKSWQFKFPLLTTDAILSTVEDYVNDIGRMPHFLDIFEDVDDWIYYGHLTNDRISDIRQNEIGFMYRDIEFIFKESM